MGYHRILWEFALEENPVTPARQLIYSSNLNHKAVLKIYLSLKATGRWHIKSCMFKNPTTQHTSTLYVTIQLKCFLSDKSVINYYTWPLNASGPRCDLTAQLVITLTTILIGHNQQEKKLIKN